MRFETAQHMKLSQQMKLAPRMIQSMEILQMPLMALQERIDQELESNIALEQLEPGMDLDQLRRERKEAEREDRMGERELVVGDATPNGAEDFERLSIMESSYKDAFENEYTSTTYRKSAASGERVSERGAAAGPVISPQDFGASSPTRAERDHSRRSGPGRGAKQEKAGRGGREPGSNRRARRPWTRRRTCCAGAAAGTWRTRGRKPPSGAPGRAAAHGPPRSAARRARDRSSAWA